MSPTQRSLKRARECGWTVQVVERRVPRSNLTQDLFGCIDLLAISTTGGILGVQATTGSHASARCRKAIKEPRLVTWLEAGGQFHVWAWAKRGPRGERKLWSCRVLRAYRAGALVAFEPIQEWVAA